VSIMKFVLVALIVGLVAKDTSQLNDPYVLRGAAQLMCLLVGGFWLVTHISSSVVARYWLVFAYLGAIVLSVAGAPAPRYVLFQGASLGATLLFYVAYFERYRGSDERAIGLLVRVTTGTYAVVAVLSLVLLLVAPGMAYGAINTGDAGLEYRFRGLFSQAGLMGTAAGVTLGMAWFGLRRNWVKLLVMVPTAICLALTLSRTAWVACFLAGVLTLHIYAPRLRTWLAIITVACAGTWATIAVLGIDVDLKSASKITRAGSIASLSGRVELWSESLNAFQRSPFFGYGFTTGAAGLEHDAPFLSHREFGAMNSDPDASRDIGRRTMHSGYLQSLLDLGVVGTVFYLAVMVTAVLRLYRFGRERRYAAAFYGLIFLMIANFSESIIYSAAVFSSLLFWGLAIFALSLRGSPQARVAVRRAGVPAADRVIGPMRPPLHRPPRL